ncbi:MAG: hypothetical protein ACLQFR_11340 [Streptosporangiaceae bacterium]
MNSQDDRPAVAATDAAEPPQPDQPQPDQEPAKPPVPPWRRVFSWLIAGPAWVWRAGRERYRFLQGLLALAVYLAAWLSTSARPLVEHLSTPQLDQSSQDPNFYVWCLRWWPYAISHGLNPFYTAEIGLPVGHNLAWVTTAGPLALLAWPLTAAAGPVVSFSLLVALGPPLSAWAAFVLCRRLTGRFFAALAGGAIFGFSAYVMNHTTAGQLNVTYTLLLPLMAYLIVLWRDGAIGPRVLVALLAAAMTVQFYLFLETFAGLTAILAIGFLVGYAVAGSADRQQIARLARLTGLAFAITAVLIGPYLAFALTHVPPKFVHASGLDVASLIVPRPGRTFGLTWLAHAAASPVGQSAESAEGYVGIPLLLLAACAAVVAWSSRMTRFLTVMLVVITVAAVGPFVYWEGKSVVELPWAKVWMLPILRSAFPSRLMVFAFLALAVITAIFLARPFRWRWTRWARWPVAALAVAAIVADMPTFGVLPSTDLPTFISAGWYRHQLSPRETVVVISDIGNAGLLWQADSNFYIRLAGGYINAVITPRTDLPLAVQNLDFATPLYVEQFRAFIRRSDIGAILVQANAAPRWIGIFSRLGLKGELVGGVLIYRTDGCRTCHLVLLGDSSGHQAARADARAIASFRSLPHAPATAHVRSASRDAVALASS